MRETPKCPGANGCNRTRDQFQPGRGFATPPRLARWKAPAGERHRQNFALLKIVDGLAKLLADVFRKGANRGPRRRMEDRRLHSFNVSYLGHGVKEAKASAENNEPSRRRGRLRRVSCERALR